MRRIQYLNNVIGFMNNVIQFRKNVTQCSITLDSIEIGGKGGSIHYFRRSCTCPPLIGGARNLFTS